MPFLVRELQRFVFIQVRTPANLIEQLTADLTTVRHAPGRGSHARIACRAREAAFEIRERCNKLRSLESAVSPSSPDRCENIRIEETIDGLVRGKEASTDKRCGAVHGQDGQRGQLLEKDVRRRAAAHAA